MSKKNKLTISEKSLLHEMLITKMLEKDKDGKYKILQDLNKGEMIYSIIRKLHK